jgi:hypothetical protein
MIRPDGGLTWVQSASVPTAQSSGYRIASTADKKRATDAEEFGDSAILAGLAGAGRGLSFGLSDQFLVRTGLVGAEKLRGLKEYNPQASVAGEVLGTLAPLLVTGGTGIAGLGLRTLGTGVRGVSAGGRAVSGAIKAALPAAKTLRGKVVRDAIAQGAGATVEGTAYGLGHAISEDALGDPDDVAELLMGSVGLSALTGGVAGGLFGAAGSLAKHALSGKSMAKLWARQQGLDAGEDFATASQRQPPPGLASKIEGDIKGTFDAASKLEGKWDAALELQLEGMSPAKALASAPFKELGKEARRRAVEHVDIRFDHVRKMADLGRRAEKEANELFRLEAMGAPKKEKIRKLVNKSVGKWGAAEDKAITHVQQSLKDVRESLSRWSEVADWRATGNPTIKQIGRLADSYESQIKKIAGRAAVAGEKQNLNAELYAMMDQFKRDVGARVKGRGMAHEGIVLERMRDEVYENNLRAMLENEDIWGKMGIAQANVNKAWHRFLGNKKVYDQNFTTYAGEEGFLRQYRMDKTKLDSHFKQLGTPSADDAKEYMLKNLQYEKELVNAIEEFYELDAKSWGPRIASYRKTNADMANLYRRAQTDMGIANAAAALRRGEMPEMVAASLIGGPAAQKITGTVLGGLTAVEQIAGKYSGKIAAGVGGYMSNAAKLGKKATISAADLGRRALVPTTTILMHDAVFGDKRSKKSASRHEAYQDRLDELAIYQSSPQALMARLEKKTVELPPVIALAVMSKAHTAARYLWETAPKAPEPQFGVVKQDWVPPNSELDAWSRRVEVAQNPMSVLDHLRSRTLTRQHVEALQAVYPKIYERTVTEIIRRASAIGEDLPYSDRVQLSILFGVPIEPTTRPDIVRMHQQMHAATPQQPQQVAGQKNRVSGIAKLTLGERVETQAQRIEGGI